MEDIRGLKLFLKENERIIERSEFPRTYNELQATLSSIYNPTEVMIKIISEDDESIGKKFEVNSEESFKRALEQISGRGLILDIQRIVLTEPWGCKNCHARNEAIAIICYICKQARR